MLYFRVFLNIYDIILHNFWDQAYIEMIKDISRWEIEYTSTGVTVSPLSESVRWQSSWTPWFHTGSREPRPTRELPRGTSFSENKHSSNLFFRPDKKLGFQIQTALKIILAHTKYQLLPTSIWYSVRGASRPRTTLPLLTHHRVGSASWGFQTQTTTWLVLGNLVLRRERALPCGLNSRLRWLTTSAPEAPLLYLALLFVIGNSLPRNKKRRGWESTAGLCSTPTTTGAWEPWLVPWEGWGSLPWAQGTHTHCQTTISAVPASGDHD